MAGRHLPGSGTHGSPSQQGQRATGRSAEDEKMQCSILLNESECVCSFCQHPLSTLKPFKFKSLNTHLQRRDLQGVLHQGGCAENNGLRDEGRLDGSRVKQVGVVAHFAELHEDINHRHEVTAGQRFPGPVRSET